MADIVTGGLSLDSAHQHAEEPASAFLDLKNQVAMLLLRLPGISNELDRRLMILRLNVFKDCWIFLVYFIRLHGSGLLQMFAGSVSGKGYLWLQRFMTEALEEACEITGVYRLCIR